MADGSGRPWRAPMSTTKEERKHEAAMDARDRLDGVLRHLDATRDEVTRLRAVEATLTARVDELTRERDEAVRVLAPSMPSSGLVDACRQVKQVAVSEAHNSDTAMKLLDAATRERDAAREVLQKMAQNFGHIGTDLDSDRCDAGDRCWRCIALNASFLRPAPLADASCACRRSGRTAPRELHPGRRASREAAERWAQDALEAPLPVVLAGRRGPRAERPETRPCGAYQARRCRRPFRAPR